MSELSTWGRFGEPAVLILVSLAAGPTHGYAIMEEIKATTGKPMRAGTLYAALNRLEHAGMIEPLPADDRRKPYRLTAAGRAYVRGHLTSMSAVAKKGLRRLTAP